jgi:hypothetical protein
MIAPCDRLERPAAKARSVGGSATGWWFRDTLRRGWQLRIVGGNRHLGLRTLVSSVPLAFVSGTRAWSALEDLTA